MGFPLNNLKSLHPGDNLQVQLFQATVADPAVAF